MKKRELLLDFTSLLDVILILLFIVVVNTGQAALDASADSQQALSQVQEQVDVLSGQNRELQGQLDAALEYKAQLEQLQGEYDALSGDLSALQDAYEYLKITTDYDPGDVSVYEEAIKHMTKIVLICSTSQNQETGRWEVLVDVYLGSADDRSQTYTGSATIVHDFDLSLIERETYNARQAIEVTKLLSEALRQDKSELVWISIQYAYNDQNFSISDLQIIGEAIDSLERSFSVVCYAEEIKLNKR